MDTKISNVSSCTLEEKLTEIKQKKATRLVFSELLFSEERFDLTLFFLKIVEMDYIQHLCLEGLKIDSIPVSLASLTNLRILDLRNCGLTKFPESVLEISGLQILDLKSNNLDTIPASIGKLRRLQALGLSNNNLVELPTSLSELKSLRHLDLESNLFGAELQAAFKYGIRSLFIYLEETNKVQIYEGKLMIVGEPGAGKTSLMKKLVDPSYIPSLGKSPTTHGINVEKWDFDYKGNDFHVNLWDFGGQEIQYATHQFFLTSNAVYVLVVDNREQRTNLDYWFETIELLGRKNCPVILFLHDKEKEIISNIDIDIYRKRFTNLVITQVRANLANKNPTDFLDLQKMIKDKLVSLPHIGSLQSTYWLNLKSKIHSLKRVQNYISEKGFKELCVLEGVRTEHIEALKKYLTWLGVIVSFEDTELKDFIIINPQWAVDPLYTVLDQEQVKNANGYFNRRFFSEQLRQLPGDYSDVEINNLLTLLTREHFEICFCIDKNEPYDEQRFIVPQLLEEQELTIYGETKALLEHTPFSMEYRYPFMPKGLFPRMIVRQDDNIHSCETLSKPLVWRNGMVLSRNEAIAIVKLDVPSNKNYGQIAIRVHGMPRDKHHLTNLLRDNFRKLHLDLSPSLKVEEYVPCNCSKCIKSDFPYVFPHGDIERNLKNKKSTIECRFSSEDVQIKHLIEGVVGDFEDIQSEDNIDQKKLYEKCLSVANNAKQQEIISDKVNLYNHHFKERSRLWKYLSKDGNQTFESLIEFLDLEIRYFVPKDENAPRDKLLNLLELAIKGLAENNKVKFELNNTTNTQINLNINIDIKNDICFQLDGLIEGLKHELGGVRNLESENAFNECDKAKMAIVEIECSSDKSTIRQSINKLKNFVKNIKNLVNDANETLDKTLNIPEKIVKIQLKITDLIDWFQQFQA